MHASAEASGDSSGGSSGRPPAQQQQPAPGPQHPVPTAQQLQQMFIYQQMLGPGGQFDVARWSELAAATPAPMYQASMAFAPPMPPLPPAQPQLPTAQAPIPAPMYQAPMASAHAGPPLQPAQPQIPRAQPTAARAHVLSPRSSSQSMGSNQPAEENPLKALDVGDDVTAQALKRTAIMARNAALTCGTEPDLRIQAANKLAAAAGALRERVATITREWDDGMAQAEPSSVDKRIQLERKQVGRVTLQLR